MLIKKASKTDITKEGGGNDKRKQDKYEKVQSI